MSTTSDTFPLFFTVRMRKMGVGLAQVQQLAFVEAKIQPEQLEQLLLANEEGKKDSVQVGLQSPSGNMQKYLDRHPARWLSDR